MKNTVDTIAERFRLTYSRESIDPNFGELFSDNVVVWHNYESEMSVPGRELASIMVRMVSASSEILRDHHDSVWALQVSPDGFTLAATLEGELPDGTPVRIPRCLLIDVKDGLIVRINEFGDLGQREPYDNFLKASGKFRT
ncbi:hypothetical protein V1227_16895 [Lentzea sp. DG1S-22]|uniref:nuclear transport factor 2 family protein n=1 Tax=Lentzea sp. DG1S-22 TaxID=3108822 RepID=UPI002E7923A0|nr:hypothetical protein [Lentzea sp. DG1S-22]WVH84349.1 hypothetical protein V1227_16895 [Lentzea sp. DG1S-22]